MKWLAQHGFPRRKPKGSSNGEAHARWAEGCAQFDAALDEWRAADQARRARPRELPC